MTKIRLETDDGKWVLNAQIPPFKKEPEVLFWGSRVFQKRSVLIYGGEGRVVYREAFAFTLLPDMEG